MERATGFKLCTGGSGCLPCLRKMLDTVLWPEI